MSRILVAVALVFILGLSAESQSTIKGRVTDSEGAVIAKARVLIHWDSSSPVSDTKKSLTQDVSVMTDSRGEYAAAVPVGFYDIFVSAPLFTPIAAKVIVKDRQQAKFNAKLYVDPLVSKEIGGMEVEGVPPKP
jgi:Carboxypeptidase regulatory-like domain